MAVCELQLVPGSAGHRPRRAGRVRRIHRRRLEQPDSLRQQPVLGPDRNALSEQEHDRRQHQRGSARREFRPHVGQAGLRDRLDVPGRRTAEARQGMVLQLLPVLPAEVVALRLSSAGAARAIPGRPMQGDVAAVHLQADHQARTGRSAHRLHRARQLHRRRRRRRLERGAGSHHQADRTRIRVERQLHEGPLPLVRVRRALLRLLRLLRARAVQRPRPDGMDSTSTPTSIR